MASDRATLESLLARWAAAGPEPPGRLAEEILQNVESWLATEEAPGPTVAHRYLELSRHPSFLQQLPDRAARYRWAETTFAIIERTDFTFETMFAQRVVAAPDSTLFQDLGHRSAERWSYAQIAQRLRGEAAVFLSAAASGPGTAADAPPRVAILADNSIGSACCDLACLLYGIFVTPLNVHFDADTVLWIMQRVQINTVITDTPERASMLQGISARLGRPLRIFHLHDAPAGRESSSLQLEAAVAALSTEEISERLAARPRLGMHETITVMFTSGSTGQPKGVAFSTYNLVTKRFARAAALPKVGEDEILLCYLPLYHTFGRYLEMMGAIFWGGTYVFAGNPSADTLLAQFQQVRPTALISIPLRWVQIRDYCLELVAAEGKTAREDKILRRVVGDRLRWGLSAAGYLDPKVFRFFQRHGVELCSGFGMTEGTGGLTMTPPDDYQDNSVGIALPGVRTRFSEVGELQISGPYIARYLPADEDSAGEDVPDADSVAGIGDGPDEVSKTLRAADDDEYWLATGDLFRTRPDGHLEIVDRIKDIYKNSRGETIAPRKVEQKFTGVPGIQRTFLVGDNRRYNTLLIVCDLEDPVLQTLRTSQEKHDYFHQIVTAANQNLASFERVVNFAVLERDFSLEQAELTPKGSYRRKEIEKNFAATINDLYRRNISKHTLADLQVLIPLWFFRDLGVLEDDIIVHEHGLTNRQTGRRLRIHHDSARNRVQVGDLEYSLQGHQLDLGTFSRQPLLWVGNPELMAFCPCREGWDTSLGEVSEQVFLPPRANMADSWPAPPNLRDQGLGELDALCRQALFGPSEKALAAIEDMEDMLGIADTRFGKLIRRRLEALAYHQVEEVRCRAYQTLVLDEPVPDYNRYLPAFIESGLTFLCEDSIAAIASTNIETRRLHAFRQRLHSYRAQLAWPASAETRRVFDDLFHLLADFARYHPEFYASVREELVSWILHHEDPELARCAEGHFHRLATWFEQHLMASAGDEAPEAWQAKLILQEGLSERESASLREILVGTTFLRESLLLAFAGAHFDLQDIGPGGIWVSRILSLHEYSRYRVSINMLDGRHFDLQLIIREDLDEGSVLETIFWFIAVHGYPHGAAVLPRFGCCRPELGAISLAYVNDLTVWEKIREYSSAHDPQSAPHTPAIWRRLFVSAMATVFRGWHYSGRRIVPGAVTPSNLVVPEPDFMENSLISSLTGWRSYTDPVSLVRPLYRNFYRQTTSHYPWCRNHLVVSWIFEACTEALGVKASAEFLRELHQQLQDNDWPEASASFREDLERYLQRLQQRYYAPLPLRSAIGRYQEWAQINAQSTARARLDILDELIRLYRLDRFPQIARYTLYRQTYFASSSLQVEDIYDRLLTELFRQPERRATQMVLLSDLQAALTDPDDRRAFRRLAFPGAEPAQQVEVLMVGDRAQAHLIVRSIITDRHDETYTVCEPTTASEVGQLYRLFLLAGFPKTISEQDRFFIATDKQENIIGGIFYKHLPDEIVHLDGIVVTRSLLERGLTSALLEDFCARMADEGCLAVKTHFFLRAFYQRRGFRTHRSWGGLVRFLRSDPE